MIYFIIINWFNWISVWICKWVIVRLNWNFWSGNFNINIINGMMIKFPHDIWNHRVGSGRRGTGFEVSFRRLAVPLSWWLLWFVTMEGIALIHLSPKTWWEEFWITDYAFISFISNSSTAFTNNFLSHAEICNNWLESCCIIFAGRRMAEMMRALTLSGQCGWSSNNL